jgi:hypothetical protein
MLVAEAQIFCLCLPYDLKIQFLYSVISFPRICPQKVTVRRPARPSSVSELYHALYEIIRYTTGYVHTLYTMLCWNKRFSKHIILTHPFDT